MAAGAGRSPGVPRLRHRLGASPRGSDRSASARAARRQRRRFRERGGVAVHAGHRGARHRGAGRHALAPRARVDRHRTAARRGRGGRTDGSHRRGVCAERAHRGDRSAGRDLRGAGAVGRCQRGAIRDGRACRAPVAALGARRRGAARRVAAARPGGAARGDGSARPLGFRRELLPYLDEAAASADLLLPTHTPLESWHAFAPRRGRRQRETGVRKTGRACAARYARSGRRAQDDRRQGRRHTARHMSRHVGRRDPARTRSPVGAAPRRAVRDRLRNQLGAPARARRLVGAAGLDARGVWAPGAWRRRLGRSLTSASARCGSRSFDAAA